MKTVNELRSIFIQGRFNNGTPFYHFTKKTVYEGYTTFDWLRMNFKGIPESFKGTMDECNKLKLPYNDMEVFISKHSSETERRINSRFDKYRIELNDFLQKN